jgi:hypothetical protein
MDLEHLLTMLASPDPACRDGKAYPELVDRLRRGEWDDRLVEIGDLLVRRFEHPEVQARTFAPSVLAAVVERDAVDTGTVRSWRDAFVSWWLGENDLRGWDQRLGWLHAVAHGADLVGALGALPGLTGTEAGALITVVGRRITAETGYRYAQMEEDRLARAVGRILARADLTAADATDWLALVDQLFAEGGPGPLPVPVANTLATLRAVYIVADRGGTIRGTAVADAIAGRLHTAFPAYPAVRAHRDRADDRDTHPVAVGTRPEQADRQVR